MATAPIIFNWRGQNRVSLKVSEKNQKTAAVAKRIKKNYGDTITFRATGTAAEPKSQFTTADPDIIQYIRANKIGRPITEDLSLIPIGCPYCDWRAEGNSQVHQEALALHLTECKGIPGAVDAKGDS